MRQLFQNQPNPHFFCKKSFFIVNTVISFSGSDYFSISKEMFQYLQCIYGGGPEIILQRSTGVSCPRFTSHMNHIVHTKSLLTTSNSTTPQEAPSSQKESSSSHLCGKNLSCSSIETKVLNWLLEILCHYSFHTISIILNMQ